IILGERELNEFLYVRKQMMKTAKFIEKTANTSRKTRDLLRKFPQVDCLVMIAEMPGCLETCRAAKSVNPAIPIILLSANQTSRCGPAEHHVCSHEPEALLNLLRSMFGDPRKAA